MLLLYTIPSSGSLLSSACVDHQKERQGYLFVKLHNTIGPSLVRDSAEVWFRNIGNNGDVLPRETTFKVPFRRVLTLQLRWRCAWLAIEEAY